MRHASKGINQLAANLTLLGAVPPAGGAATEAKGSRTHGACRTPRTHAHTRTHAYARTYTHQFAQMHMPHRTTHTRAGVTRPHVMRDTRMRIHDCEHRKLHALPVTTIPHLPRPEAWPQTCPGPRAEALRGCAPGVDNHWQFTNDNKSVQVLLPGSTQHCSAPPGSTGCYHPSVAHHLLLLQASASLCTTSAQAPGSKASLAGPNSLLAG